MTIGERVYHRTAGVCILQDIRKLDHNGEDYYVLSPCFENGSTLFVPASRAELSLRPVMSQIEADRLIASLPGLEPFRFSTANEKKQHTSQIMKSGDSTGLARLSKTYYTVQKDSPSPRSNYSTSQNNLRQIEKLLFGELAVALGIERDEVLPYIDRQLTK